MRYAYSSDWIHMLESKQHWEYYWYQQKLMQSRIDKEAKILEVGVGSGFTANYMKSQGFTLNTVDIDAQKKPDFVMNIVEMDKSLDSYDVLLAFNIFEHLPFNDFLRVLDHLSVSSIHKLFIGLPLFRKIVMEGFFRVSVVPPLRFNISMNKRKIKAEHHHWELGYKDFTLKRIRHEMHERAFQLMGSEKCRTQQYLYFEKMKG